MVASSKKGITNKITVTPVMNNEYFQRREELVGAGRKRPAGSACGGEGGVP